MNEKPDLSDTRTKPLVPDAPAEEPSPQQSPEQIGPYRVERLLGQGGFGRVYLAYDEHLDRRVAIKVPHRHLVTRLEDVELYLAEARTVAQLEHPHIVPVYHVGSTDEHPFFFVSKFIEGSTLSKRIRESKLSLSDAVDLVATVADALHYAHQKGVVHRDIKPSNVLLELGVKPYLADFGLALREEDIGKGPRNVGTPAYMSPEQARGEGHRVDGRSDIFSLGVVLYQLLTERPPFRGESRADLLEQITTCEPRSPRQIDDVIPPELERICLKALSKRASERYSTAKDMADELRAFFAQQTVLQPPTPPAKSQALTPAPPERPAASTSATPGSFGTPGGSASESPPVRIVPKGLRSFDAHDADFFLELVPGPRDREGLPDSIRFWKARIEETDPDDTFSVGLIYGPSGCGKSSLVKAGLLPRLSTDVVAVYCEATADDTETRLLNGLRKRFPAVAADQDLKETLTSLRRGRGLPASKKVLIVIDQFEQWLHAHREERNPHLVQALRQCDGGRVQCVLMVRDDFWLAISRFMRELEVRLVEGQNSALVDLFDEEHAKKVLTAFGRAFGKLPEKRAEMDKQQREFVKQAVHDLAREGKVVCVRLTLFAEMMKGRPWTPASLKELGGAKGVGVTFLEETFSASTAPPAHRYHQKAARAVLKALLPESGADIKGHLRSCAELLEVSRYPGGTGDFDALIRILDSEIRLITPSDPEGSNSDSQGQPADPGGQYYQLTHDYLVPAVRDWLARKQKETRQGRAGLRLAEHAAVWMGKPSNRLLPAWWEWLNIRLRTRQRDWTPGQRKMMKKAGQYHGARGGALVVILFLATWGTWEFWARLKANSFRDRLWVATIAEVPTIVREMGPYRDWVNPRLRDGLAQAEAGDDSKKQLNFRLALLAADAGQVDHLSERLLTCEAADFAVIREILLPYREQLTGRLWAELENGKDNADRRFRAACALALFSPEDPRWDWLGREVAAKLLTENPLVLGDWQTALHPVGEHLLAPLAGLLEDNKWERGQRRAIIEFYRVFSAGAPSAYAPLEERLSSVEVTGLKGPGRAKGKANVAAALLALGKSDKVWPLLVHTPNPTVRSFLIERLASSAINPKTLSNRLSEERDTSARRAIILTLGGFEPNQVPELIPVLLDLYENDLDPGVHAAAGWVLRIWKQDEQLEIIDKNLATGRAQGRRDWFINKQRQTFSIIHETPAVAPNAGNNAQGSRHAFAIAVTEVTVQQFLAFKRNHQYDRNVATTPNSPVNMVSWHDAAEYCNWLSKQDSILEDEYCYRPNKDKLLDFVPDYQRRTGYRLPTEAEWNFACLAGAQTAWCFGEADEEITGKYAWWSGNSRSEGIRRSFPVAQLKPNDWGLFDMHGNLAEWCMESAEPQVAKPFNDIESAGRGGYYTSDYRGVRSDRRFQLGRRVSQPNIGFRPVRTIQYIGK
ncbi:MAG TPA: SUMF1/EgtB/PvdO family nonheme iron enzyme [Gemmataceae bacterium]|nr:SUMF1/EgtB/PvdO family nonheme iron enzyme [Gemmataceae bacterium]